MNLNAHVHSLHTPPHPFPFLHRACSVSPVFAIGDRWGSFNPYLIVAVVLCLLLFNLRARCRMVFCSVCQPKLET